MPSKKKKEQAAKAQEGRARKRLEDSMAKVLEDFDVEVTS